MRRHAACASWPCSPSGTVPLAGVSQGGLPHGCPCPVVATPATSRPGCPAAARLSPTAGSGPAREGRGGPAVRGFLGSHLLGDALVARGDEVPRHRRPVDWPHGGTWPISATTRRSSARCRRTVSHRGRRQRVCPAPWAHLASPASATGHTWHALSGTLAVGSEGTRHLLELAGRHGGALPPGVDERDLRRPGRCTPRPRTTGLNVDPIGPAAQRLRTSPPQAASPRRSTSRPHRAHAFGTRPGPSVRIFNHLRPPAEPRRRPGLVSNLSSRPWPRRSPLTIYGDGSRDALGCASVDDEIAGLLALLDRTWPARSTSANPDEAHYQRDRRPWC